MLFSPQIALLSPRLWSVVSGSDLPQSWVLKMINLSNSAPLSLSLDLVKHRALLPQLLHILEPHVSARLAHLSIQYPDAPEDAATFAEQLAETPSAPTLKSLEICGGHALALPSNIFSSTCPQLEALTLKRCFLPWSANVYDRLIHLDIQLSPEESEYDHQPTLTGTAHVQMPMSSIQEAAAALQNMPRLQTLRLRNVLPSKDTPIHTPPHPIDLPYLSDLELEGGVQSCVALITHILVPAQTNITLYLDCADPAALATMAVDLGFPSKSPRVLELDFGGRYELAMRMRFSDPEGARGEGQGVFTLHVNSDTQFCRWHAMDKYTSLAASISLDRLEHLLYRACFTRFWLAPEWERVLRHGTPNLREITALGTPAGLSLAESVERWDMACSGISFVPALRHLCFAGCQFRGAGSQPEVAEKKTVWNRGSSSLWAVLHGRSQGPSSGPNHGSAQNAEGHANELVTVELVGVGSSIQSPPAIHQARL
ncbi:hypothetical protein OF83DRAFT_1175768 [Amylostereum chailletii]|nr:hypothetical protein OF83DRAFT_1175768 [Amylostereum chailletii]